MIDLLQLETLCRCATISTATSTRGFLFALTLMPLMMTPRISPAHSYTDIYQLHGAHQEGTPENTDSVPGPVGCC